MPSEVVRPYLPRLTIDWARDQPDTPWQAVDGSLAFVDISGFTKMSERLARHGKVGAEEVAGAIGTCFEALLAVAYAAGGSLLKFGGDALLLLFTGGDHAERAALCAVGMQRRLADVGRLETTAGRVVLRMSAGVHSGRVHCFLAGTSHRELILCGETVSKVVEMEGSATAGQVIVSRATAAALPATLLGPETGPGIRLRRVATPPRYEPTPPVSDTGDDLSRYLSTEVRAHTLAGVVDAQHRQATVAFLHFDDTDELLATEGPDVTAAALDELVTNVQEAADTHSVTFLASDIDHDGGKLVLVAGAPRATGDDEVRMLTTLRRIADRPGKLPFRIGVNRGATFAGDVGPSYRRTYTTMGDTVNLAARLMAKAEPGQILASTTVVDRAGARFETEPAGPFDMKGVRDPVPAFAIGATRRRRQVASTALPLVGRDAEIAAFTADLEAVRAGAGRVVELVGEPGIGKSRLTDELRALGADLPGVTITCEAYDSATPYAPFWWLLHDLLGLAQDASPELVEGKLRQAVADVSPELEAMLPLLGTPLDLDIPETSETASLAPEFRAVRVQEATALFLDRILPNPVLLVLEDVHWIDDASRGVLDLVIQGLRRRPALLCMTRRDTERAYTAPELDHVRTLRPAPLTRAQCREALLGATEDAPMQAHAVGVLAERAGGNPLFLGELLSAAAQGGDVDALPDSVDAVVTAQIDRLPPDRRRLLRVASVLGRAFSLADLTAILDPGLEPPDAAAWEDLSGFLTFDGPGALRFKHALLRDTAYEELPFRVRKDLHGRAGAALAASLGDHAESEAELLSMHFFYAHLYADAWRYARIAGTRASVKYANHEAAELLERALAAVRRVADAPSLEVAAVWETLGDVRERAGMFESALAAYRGARRLRKGDALGQASLLLKESWIAERDGRYSQSVRLARRSRRALDDTDQNGAAALRAQVEGWEATVRQAQGRSEDAVAGCLRAIDAAQRAGAKEAEAHARFILDWAYVELGRPELAVHSARALEIYEELGNLDGQAVVINNLGGFAYFEGRWDDAVELYERGRERRRRSGNIIEAETGTLNIGEILADRGLDNEAERCFRTAQRAWRAAAYPAGVALTEMHLARIAARRGHFDEAFAGFARARDEFGAIEAHGDVLEVDTRTAECHLLRADPDAALALANNALRAARAEGGAQLAALQRIRGLALFALGSFTESADALGESLSEARARGAIFDIALALDAQAEIATRQHEDETARRSREESAELFEMLGVRDPTVVGAAARISVDRSAGLPRAAGSRT